MSSQLEYQQQSISSSTKTCAIHPSLDCAFICIDPQSTGIIFKCDFCVAEQSLMGKHLVPIKQIKDSDEKTIFYNWPFLSTDLHTELKEILSKPSQEQRFRNDIAQYFKDLRVQILSKIDEIQLKMEQKANNLVDFSNQIVTKYNDLSSKDILKKSVINSNDNLNDLSFRIRKIVEEAEKNKQKSQNDLRQMLDEVVLQEKAVSLEGPNQLKKEILASLDKIDMFDFEPLFFTQQSDQEKNKDSKQNVEVLLDLVSNKLNFTSSTFQTKLKSHLESIKVIVNRMDFENIYEEGRERLQLELLDVKEVQQVSRFISVLTSSKLEKNQNGNSEQKRKIEVEDVVKLVGNQMNFASDEMCGKVKEMLQNISSYVNTFKVKSVFQQDAYMVDISLAQAKNLRKILPSFKSLLSQQDTSKENRLGELVHVANQITKGNNKTEGKQYWNFKQLFALMKHPVNKCSAQQLQQLSGQLEGIKFYLESFEMNGIEPLPMNWERLTKEQIFSLEKLGNQISTLNQQFGDEYRNAISPNPNIQLHSSSIIDDLLPLTEKEEKDVRLILTQYPIFEMIAFPLEKQIEWQFIKPNYSSSHSLEISQIQNGTHIIQKKSIEANTVTNCILDNNLAYSLTCQFNRPVFCNNIRIGLIPDGIIHSQMVGENNCNSVYLSRNGSGGRELIKGEYLNGDKLRKEVREIEFRFCIAEKKCYYFDSTRQNINKVQSELINEKAQYRFGIGFHTPGDDWSVSVSNVKTTRNTWLIDKF